MCTVLVSYDGRNKTAKELVNLLSTTKVVKVNYDYKENSYKNGLDEAIEDIKMGRVTKHENFEEYQKAVYQELGYV
jgi:hypothetical protein